MTKMNWNNAWMSYTGPVTVVLETGLVREGQATGEVFAKAGRGCRMAVRLGQSRREVWTHPRYVFPREAPWA